MVRVSAGYLQVAVWRAIVSGTFLSQPERAGEAFGRIRTDGVIAEDVQDGMKRREELITFEGWWASFFVA